MPFDNPISAIGGVWPIIITIIVRMPVNLKILTIFNYKSQLGTYSK